MAPPKGMARKFRNRRWTAEDLSNLRDDYYAYVPTLEIARKLKRSEGTVRGKIHMLRLRRSNTITKIMPWAPEELKAQIGIMSAQDWIEACYKWREEQPEDTAPEGEALTALELKCAEIDATTGISRNDKMIAKRIAGMTLVAIGRQHGVTRERVRQLTSPDYIAADLDKQKGLYNRGLYSGAGHDISPLLDLAGTIEELDRRRQDIIDKVLAQMLRMWKVSTPEMQQKFLEAVGAVMKDKGDEGT